MSVFSQEWLNIIRSFLYSQGLDALRLQAENSLSYAEAATGSEVEVHQSVQHSTELCYALLARIRHSTPFPGVIQCFSLY